MKISPIQIQASSAKLKSQLSADPMLITETGYHSVMNRLEQITAGDVEIIEITKEPEEDLVELRQNVAVIRIHGVIAKGLEDWEKRWFGMVDIDDIREDLNRPEVVAADHVVLDINSPGGFTTGVHELATEISQRNQLVTSFTEGDMASAAYYIGCAGSQVISTASAAIGSVGVYVVLTDSSQAWREAGYSREVIKSGEHKGGGVEGVAISESYRASVQQMVDSLGEEFRAFVVSNRPTIDFGNLQGQVFLGRDALSLGFVDAVANSLSDVVSQLVD